MRDRQWIPITTLALWLISGRILGAVQGSDVGWAESGIVAVVVCLLMLGLGWYRRQRSAAARDEPQLR